MTISLRKVPGAPDGSHGHVVVPTAGVVGQLGIQARDHHQEVRLSMLINSMYNMSI